MIEHEERELIESIIEFGDTVAREVMVPRPDMVTVAARRHGRRRARPRPSRNGFSRLPVHGRGRSTTSSGIAYTKDLMRAEREGRGDEPVRELARAGPLRPREQAGRPADARDAGRASSTWRSSPTSTAASPGWSRSRTASRSWSARSSTSTTSRTPRSSACPTATTSSTAAWRIDELNELLDVELPDERLGHRRRVRLRHARARARPRARASSRRLPLRGRGGRRPAHQQRAWSRRVVDVGADGDRRRSTAPSRDAAR